MTNPPATASSSSSQADASPGDPDRAKKGEDATNQPGVKKDDAVQQTAGEAIPPRRWFFDFFRRNSEP
jgi:hypothetical protein